MKKIIVVKGIFSEAAAFEKVVLEASLVKQTHLLQNKGYNFFVYLLRCLKI